MNDLQTYFYIATTIITLIGSLTAIIISIRRAPIQERTEENQADKMQAETTISLLTAQRTLIDPLNKRINQLEKENNKSAIDCTTLKDQLSKIVENFTMKSNELDSKIKELEIRVVEAEQYIERLIHFIRSYNLIPPPRDSSELKKAEEGRDNI